VGLFSTKSSSQGEDPKQQEKTKKKKTQKNGCREKPMELFSTTKKLHGFVFYNESVRIINFAEIIYQASLVTKRSSALRKA
jgi:hypothetical protein